MSHIITLKGFEAWLSYDSKQGSTATEGELEGVIDLDGQASSDKTRSGTTRREATVKPSNAECFLTFSCSWSGAGITRQWSNGTLKVFSLDDDENQHDIQTFEFINSDEEVLICTKTGLRRPPSTANKFKQYDIVAEISLGQDIDEQSDAYVICFHVHPEIAGRKATGSRKNKARKSTQTTLPAAADISDARRNVAASISVSHPPRLDFAQHDKVQELRSRASRSLKPESPQSISVSTSKSSTISSSVTRVGSAPSKRSFFDNDSEDNEEERPKSRRRTQASPPIRIPSPTVSYTAKDAEDTPMYTAPTQDLPISLSFGRPTQSRSQYYAQIIARLDNDPNLDQETRELLKMAKEEKKRCDNKEAQQALSFYRTHNAGLSDRLAVTEAEEKLAYENTREARLEANDILALANRKKERNDAKEVAIALEERS